MKVIRWDEAVESVMVRCYPPEEIRKSHSKDKLRRYAEYLLKGTNQFEYEPKAHGWWCNRDRTPNEAINALPSADTDMSDYCDRLWKIAYERGKADRPTGEWIFKPRDAIELMHAKPKCSECGFESSDGGNFCPNCGADMRGEEHGD